MARVKKRLIVDSDKRNPDGTHETGYPRHPRTHEDAIEKRREIEEEFDDGAFEFTKKTGNDTPYEEYNLMFGKQETDFIRPDIVVFFHNTWFYHKTVMASHGTATITRSQLTKYRLKRNADGTAEKNLISFSKKLKK
ncbi:6780_t:CDS:2 [Cetraspora pellucida]|uniref:6780_t:CDS:1 n=1 Tax=Cetraspora pellucida TaxID=1433469 RepID=A0ACA9NX92_9GLOM|nr:6780_t:CDS:2 [Cetraspora pellucida]